MEQDDQGDSTEMTFAERPGEVDGVVVQVAGGVGSRSAASGGRSASSGKARPAQDQRDTCTKEGERLCQGKSGDRSHRSVSWL